MITNQNWFVWALLSAVFAALTAIFAKVGLEGVNSDFESGAKATAIQTLRAFPTSQKLREASGLRRVHRRFSQQRIGSSTARPNAFTNQNP